MMRTALVLSLAALVLFALGGLAFAQEEAAPPATEPAKINLLPLEAAVLGSPFTVRVKAEGDGNIKEIRLFHRAGGQGAFLSLKMAGQTGGIYPATIPTGHVTETGIEF